MLKLFQSRKRQDIWASFGVGIATSRWTHPDGKERVYLIARHDGTFSCGSEYFSDDKNEMCWIPQGNGGSIFAAEDIAIKEIHVLFPWSANVVPESQQM